jgi:hypothetical protein
MSLLSIVQTVAQRVGITVPTVAIASTDSNIQQVISFVNEDGSELAARYGWQEITNEANFATVASGNSQGSIQALAGPDFNYVLNETMWDRTTRRPVFGPKTAAEWQQLQAQFVNGPWWQYRIRGNQVLFIPTPPAGDQIYFEWVSKWWCTSTGGTVQTASAMVADTDIGILDERLITLGAIWRYKAGKKLDYAEDFDKAEAAIMDAMSRNASKPKLNLAGPQGNIQPGVFVPAGNWNGVSG